MSIEVPPTGSKGGILLDNAVQVVIRICDERDSSRTHDYSDLAWFLVPVELG
jgi:hypothetical protein